MVQRELRIRSGQLRVDLQGLSQQGVGCLVLAGQEQDPRGAEGQAMRNRVQLERALRLTTCFGEPVHAGKQHGVPGARGYVAGVQFQRASQFTVGPGEVALPPE